MSNCTNDYTRCESDQDVIAEWFPHFNVKTLDEAIALVRDDDTYIDSEAKARDISYIETAREDIAAGRAVLAARDEDGLYLYDWSHDEHLRDRACCARDCLLCDETIVAEYCVARDGDHRECASHAMDEHLEAAINVRVEEGRIAWRIDDEHERADDWSDIVDAAHEEMKRAAKRAGIEETYEAACAAGRGPDADVDIEGWRNIPLDRALGYDS